MCSGVVGAALLCFAVTRFSASLHGAECALRSQWTGQWNKLPVGCGRGSGGGGGDVGGVM